ncbi:hypothetical protein GGR55DRAFT_628728 [Xylaria sp. FL0064]|nr:hypothetical protein GGR55DRAFT_628728 [Xylaria sp. FL0064]
MDMLQMSPDFSRNLKHLSVRASREDPKDIEKICQSEGENAHIILYHYQGRDVNIIHSLLVDQLGLTRMKICDLGIERLFLLNSAGKTDPVTEFVVFVADVNFISRPIWAIVQPDGGKLTNLMILGLPWLWDVMAVIDVRNNVLTIGDHAVKEVPVRICGPSLSFAGKHRLALAHMVPKLGIERPVEESSDSEISPDDSDSSGLESEN